MLLHFSLCMELLLNFGKRTHKFSLSEPLYVNGTEYHSRKKYFFLYIWEYGRYTWNSVWIKQQKFQTLTVFVYEWRVFPSFLFEKKIPFFSVYQMHFRIIVLCFISFFSVFCFDMKISFDAVLCWLNIVQLMRLGALI